MLKKTSFLLSNTNAKFISFFIDSKILKTPLIPCRLVRHNYCNNPIPFSPREVIHTNSQAIRYASKEVGKNKNPQDQEIAEEESDGEESADEKDESEYFNRTFAEDKNLPFNFRERKHVLNSTRIDSVICGGLNISKKILTGIAIKHCSKVSDLLLGSKIKLNGRKVLKKSFKIQEGDYVDTTIVDDNRTRVKRVRVVGMVDRGDGRYEVYLRSWKGGIEGVGSLEGGNWT